MNFKPKTIWTGDCLDVMRGMNSGCADMVYLDPPFNSKADYSAPIGSKAAGAEFSDTWTLTDLDVEWINLIEAKHPHLHRVLMAAMTNSDKSYLAYMAVRVLEIHRVLKPTGSVYLHCDPTMSHYLKLVLDAVFGRKAYRNEIVWHYGGRGAKAVANFFPRNHDIILFYAKERHRHNRQHVVVKIPLAKSGYRIDEEGRCFRTAPRGDYTDASIEKLDAEGRIYRTRNGKVRIKYFEEFDGANVHERKLVGSTWNDIPDAMHISKKEKTGYPTQKPLALLERVIKASTDKGDLVLDPFCGCATTCVAADGLGRQWAGIDISPKAAELVRTRIEDAQGLWRDITHLTDLPRRTDMGRLPHPKTHKKTLYGEQGGHCNGCGEHFRLQNLTIDHIIARAKGGTDHVDNLQLLCHNCNSVKGDRGQEYLIAKLFR